MKQSMGLVIHVKSSSTTSGYFHYYITLYIYMIHIGNIHVTSYGWLFSSPHKIHRRTKQIIGIATTKIFHDLQLLHYSLVPCMKIAIWVIFCFYVSEVTWAKREAQEDAEKRKSSSDTTSYTRKVWTNNCFLKQIKRMWHLHKSTMKRSVGWLSLHSHCIAREVGWRPPVAKQGIPIKHAIKMKH